MEDKIQQLYVTIYKTYLSSHTQQLAFSVIISDILKGDLMWVEDRGSTLRKIEEADMIWDQFVRDFVLNLCLYGFVLYRAKKRANGKLLPEVAIGHEVYLEYNKDKATWEPHATSADSYIKGSKKWKLLILEPPQRSSDDTINMTPSSAGQRALKASQQLELLEENFLMRDDFNTRPSVFTSVSKNLLNTNNNSKPWFQAVNSAMVPTPQVPQDFNTLIQDRADAIEQLDTMSERIRLNTQMQYAGNQQLMRVGTNGKEPIKEVMEHREYFVSDGKDATLANRLGGEGEHSKIYTFAQAKVLYAWQVPPQRLGINVNSERMASSRTLTERSLEQYEIHLRILKRYIGDALMSLSSLPSRPDVFIKLLPCVNPWTLDRLEPLLKPEVTLSLYACTYGLPEEYFSKTAIKKRQEALLEKEMKKQKTDDDSDAKQRNRPELTEEQKTANQIKKGVQDNDNKK